MKKIVTLIAIIIFSQLSACSRSARYTDVVVPLSLTASQSSSQTRVSAAIEQWRDSGVIVEKGSKYKLTAKGQWRTYPICNFTGPNGIGLYVGLCTDSPLFKKQLPGYSHSTLVAKIGKRGKLFSVGDELEFTASADGKLLFRINDCRRCNYDNEGYVDVDIEIINPPVEQVALMQQSLNDFDSEQDFQTSDLKYEQVPHAFENYQPENAELALAVVKQVSKPRHALVIGNSAYLNSPLKNPANDAEAMAESLKHMGFNVILKLDADLQQMESAIDLFSRKVVSGDQVALFYYAGHGVQVDGENYLIPLKANINRQSDVRYKAVNVGQVLGAMGEGNDNLNIVILDACRNNPLPRSFRSSSRGLAKVAGPKGTIIGFATSPGSVASDGEGDNGVYTKHLLNNMKTPGISVERVFKKVLQGVHRETKGMQTPWTESSFTGDFSFQ